MTRALAVAIPVSPIAIRSGPGSGRGFCAGGRPARRVAGGEWGIGRGPVRAGGRVPAGGAAATLLARPAAGSEVGHLSRPPRTRARTHRSPDALTTLWTVMVCCVGGGAT